jgi:alkanesulfonate monooxygenase SsuD/methylene tetrahydromethanopterin reductase-like flavin-dependent oxidoreductase (luciferase family)
MKFGIFDYVDQRDEPLAKTYEDRFTLLKSAEARGFYAYHLTEHHATPLSSTPSPTVWLAAAARETTRIRLGTLLFLLPLYHPVRLLEELCMLDHLSNGRLDIGVGRGISRHEFGAMNEDFGEAEAKFNDALEVLIKGLTHDVLDHRGPHFQFHDVPLPWRPLQRPHPPLWYGLRSVEGHDRPARYGMNGVTLGPTDKIAKTLANFREAWKRHASDPLRALSPVKVPMVGAVRAMFIADSDREAERIARPAFKQWFDALAWLWIRRGDFPPIAVSPDYDEARRSGTLVVGSPDTVRRELLEQARVVGFDYLVLQLAFGSLGHANEMRSLALFADEVMPALDRVPVPAGA